MGRGRGGRSFRYELRSSRHIEDLAFSPLPLGIPASQPVSSQHRDLFLDTHDDTLRRRNIVCRLRLGADDSRLLSLRIGFALGESPVRVDSRVQASDVAGALAENSAAGRRLRALVDPALLVARMDLEVERLTRTADPNWLRQPRLELHYDRITVRHGGKSRSFHQLCMHARRGGLARLERLARALEHEHHLRSVPSGVRDRAEMLVKWKGGEDREEVARSADPQRTPEATRAGQAIAEFLNPELSLLAFQSRVLALAEDPRTPLRERLRFISIVSSNLDEFFMVRMAGLRQAAREQSEEQCDDGLTRREQLELIAEQVSQITSRQTRCYADCLKKLAEYGVRLVRWEELESSQRSKLRVECREQIHPALTPMAMTLSPGHPLPHLPHLSLAVAVVQRDENGRLHLAELELPTDIPRFLRVPGRTGQFITIEEVIRSNIDLVYPTGRIEGVYLFRVTRGGDLDLDEESADDLIEAVAHAARRRHFNPAVRVEVERLMPDFVRRLVLGNLEREDPAEDDALDPADVHEIDGLIDLRCLANLELPDNPSLSYEPFRASEPLDEGESMLDALRNGEMLFHHPFDSFAGTVLKFVQDASTDPDVTTIKITLYRVGDPSAIVDALIEAARSGKSVVAFVELKARFDEEHNVAWARKLEGAGGHVVSGLVGLKNHAKVTLVVRREAEKLCSYVHVGTGNYNTRSGVEYTDLSLFSARETLTGDVVDLFNALTGGSVPPLGLSRGALVAPHQLLDAFVAMTEREAAHARAGKPARITAKLNGLSDADAVRALLRASADGVKIDLVVRGICTLRPGVPGRSEGISVISVVGRLLEHSRIYRFENAGDPEYFIGSADLRPRNLRHRIELLVPVVEPHHREQLDRILDLYLNDPTAWELTSNGEYSQRPGGSPGAQHSLISGLAPHESGDGTASMEQVAR
jgi:polyphosphate kinase